MQPERKSLFVCWVQAVIILAIVGMFIVMCVLCPWIGIVTLAGLISLLVALVIHDNQ